MIPALGPESAAFPPTEQALMEPNGLLAWGGDLSATRLLAAYRRGIFPWYGEGQPILWWSPAPRCVIEPAAIHVSRRLARTLRQGRFRLTADRAFEPVILACAGTGGTDAGETAGKLREDTWITPELARAFVDLHQRGAAHSVEVWRDRQLVGGLYGLALGGVFFAESMFHAARDASKIALVALCRVLHESGFRLLDCQVENPHLMRMGAALWERQTFETALVKGLALNPATDWTERFATLTWGGSGRD